MVRTWPSLVHRARHAGQLTGAAIVQAWPPLVHRVREYGQVIASLLAAVTGAIAASTLGIAGTIIGTAVMSVASTAVARHRHPAPRQPSTMNPAAAPVTAIHAHSAAGAGSAGSPAEPTNQCTHTAIARPNPTAHGSRRYRQRDRRTAAHSPAHC